MMKRFLLALAMMFAVSPLWALFCQYCGSSMADDAKFCPKCGKNQSAAAPAPAKPATHVVVAPESPAPPVPVASPNEMPANPFDAIDGYEALLTGPTRTSGSAAEHRFRVSSALEKTAPATSGFTPSMRRLHDLYRMKYDILCRHENALGRCERGPNRVEAAAEKEKLLFTLARTNEMISYLKDRLSDPAAPARIDEMQKSLDEAVREHRVTAPYLRVEGYRVNQGHRVWVMDLVDERAMIMVLDDCGSRKALVGWLSLGDLERRTTYRRPASWVAPIQRVETEVVVVGHTWWWPGWPHPRHPRHPRSDDRHHDRDHDRHDRDRDRDSRHRH